MSKRLQPVAKLHAIFYGLVRAASEAARDSAAALRLSLEMARALKCLLVADRLHEQTLRKRAMQANPTWRRHVLNDLGCEAGLLRWEDRERRAQAKLKAQRLNPQPLYGEPRYKADHSWADVYTKGCRDGAVSLLTPQPNSVHPSIYRDSCKVDRDGYFRLAPITRINAPKKRGAPKPKGVKSTRMRYRIKSARDVISLRPKDLRFRVAPPRQDYGDIRRSNSCVKPLFKQSLEVATRARGSPLAYCA